MKKTAEDILIELLDKLRDDVVDINRYLSTERAGFVDERIYIESSVNESIIKWIEERIEIKKTVKIKEKHEENSSKENSSEENSTSIKS